jgi:acetylornithine deacetylase
LSYAESLRVWSRAKRVTTLSDEGKIGGVIVILRGAAPLDAVIRLLADLVAIPSVNPMGRPLTGSGYLESGVSDYLERFFRDREIRFVRKTVSPGRDNLIARYDAPGAKRTVLFDAHQDTVPVDGMTIPPFTPEIREGRLYGRGACDIKGGMASMLSAFERICAERPKGAASVIMACTVDEEFTHTGSSQLAEDKLGADLGIVAEPTRLDIVNTHKGAVRWKIRTRGVACHSSTPHLGDNAIYRMAGVIEGLAGYAAQLAAMPPDPQLGPPSLSVGRIEGGQSVNVVPDWCEVEVDRRVIPGESLAHLPSDVAEFLRTRLGNLDHVEFAPPWVSMPALAPGVPDAWIEAIRGVIGKKTGRAPRVCGVPYGTDGGPLAQGGLPCVVFGPGDIAQAHTKDEWVDVNEVRLAAEIYFDIACALGEK